MLEMINTDHTTKLVTDNGDAFTLYDLELDVLKLIMHKYGIPDNDDVTVKCSIYYNPKCFDKYIKTMCRYDGETITSMVPFNDILDKEQLINQILRDISNGNVIKQATNYEDIAYTIKNKLSTYERYKLYEMLVHDDIFNILSAMSHEIRELKGGTKYESED